MIKYLILNHTDSSCSHPTRVVSIVINRLSSVRSRKKLYSGFILISIFNEQMDFLSRYRRKS